ncbi:unnamed protein product [Adineta ricciae]|uniref:SAP domain-containing protein n=1 Tax=Adineta ricciae TaxID=249248 RepID=A0A815SV83_ADIRI|nr:unnamed protein product [Adineta ricciae]
MAEAQLTNQLTRIDSMTNVELRAELKRRGCPTSGNKKDLLAKLRVALQKEYEQAALETASTTSTMDSMSFDGRNNNFSNVQQSPVVSYDMNRPSLNNSTASSHNYMTPHGGSPMVYNQHMHSAEAPLTYTNLQIHDQAAGPYPPVYNLTMQQSAHASPSPTIPVPQQLTVSPGNRHPMYEQPHLQQQQQQPPPQQFSPMTTRQQRASIDTPTNVTAPAVSPERKPRTRSKKPSIDSQPIESQQPVPANNPPPIQITAPEVVQPPVISEPKIDHPTPSSTVGNNLEVNSFMSKSHEEEQKDLGQVREERGDSRSPSVDSSSVKSESVIKEIPLSGDRHRLSRSKSPKSRWHHSPSPQQPQTNQSSTTEEEQHSAAPTTNDDTNKINNQIEKSSEVDLPAESTGGSAGNEIKQNESPVVEKQEAPKKEESTPVNASKNDQQPEKATAQQQLKPSRSQTSSTSSSSSSLIKGLNRSSGNNRMNLSSDVLKTLIPDISLAPESIITDELEASANDLDHEDDNDQTNQPILDTGVGNDYLLGDSMTIGELADQKQQRNRTVVIDVTADSSSLNDDLIENSSDIRKKAPAPPIRVASYESKILLDGKTNALMMDEPVRVKDATATIEPPSTILYVRGLTRPFTVPLLKELLGRYGTLVDGEFWLDKIKSQCFVTYTTLEEAQDAREHLDGCRWPSTNPKTLSVRFGRQDEFEFSKTHDLPPDQISIGAMDTTNNRRVQEKSNSNNKTSLRRSASPTNDTKSSKKLRVSANTDVREWDLPKLQQQEDKSPTEREVIEEHTVKSNEPPPKGLDDYFRKTKAKPAIYWLALTEEQTVERARQREQRNAEREEQRRKRDLDEIARNSNNPTDSKSRSNNNDNTSSNRPQRRSPSPRDKRRRVSPSASPPRRDNKRH